MLKNRTLIGIILIVAAIGLCFGHIATVQYNTRKQNDHYPAEAGYTAGRTDNRLYAGSCGSRLDESAYRYAE